MSKLFLLVYMGLTWAHLSSAQVRSLGPQRKWHFQVEAGANYSYFFDKPSRFNKLHFPYRYTNFNNSTNNEYKHYVTYISVKVIYKNKHVLLYNNSYHDNDESYFTPYPKTGINNVYYDMTSFGYGYNFHHKNINLTFSTLLCYRHGRESYISGWRPNPNWEEPLISFITYSKPWGGSLGLQADYFITDHIGLGLNCGYYTFPFENSKLTGMGVEKNNPGLVARSFPNRHLMISTVKLFYHFALPKSLNKLNPFKRRAVKENVL